MGKLAERYHDAARSGVYRVDSAEIPLRAAAEAGARVLEIDAADALGLAKLRERIGTEDRRPHIVLVRHAPALGDTTERYAAVIEALAGIARDCRAEARPLFAVLVDPAGALPLPPLFKERMKDALE